jgi:ureidoacrylate peracid hydrolase
VTIPVARVRYRPLPVSELTIDPLRTVLLVIDLQNCFVDAAPGGPELVHSVNELADACRDARVTVVHTRQIVRRDGSNVGILRELPRFRADRLYDDTESAAFHPDLKIDERDILLAKPRFGAFHGTDLELVLRARGIDTVVIAGISTPVCCDTTAREANARDFRVIFLSDGTAATAPNAAQRQQATLKELDGLFARVATISDVVGCLPRSTSAAMAPEDARHMPARA